MTEDIHIENVRKQEAEILRPLTRYDEPMGRWVWEQKLKWNKIAVEKKVKLLTLLSFQCMKDGSAQEVVLADEWHRMFQRCVEFEQAHPTSVICFKQKLGPDPIGRWLAQSRRACVMREKCSTATLVFWKKLQTLQTIQDWAKNNTISASEKAQRILNDFRDDMKQGGYGPTRTKPTPSPYAILQVSEGASIEVVRAAYRALSLIHHPDKGGNIKSYHRIQSAYETLQKKM